MAEMRYAHQPDVLTHLKVKEDDAGYTDTLARLIRLENGLAASFDAKCGRTFGETTVAPQLRLAPGYATDLLLLPTGIARIDEVEISEPITGESRVLDAAEWLPWGSDGDGNTIGLLRTNGTWYGLRVGITGLWGDQDVEGLVPDDVREAMTTLVVKEYRRRTSSPSEQIGPDGLVVPAPSGWNDPTVQVAIIAHRVSRRRVGV